MKIALFGASGRMGKAVLKVAHMRNHSVVEIEKETNIDALFSSRTDATNFEKADVAIDFSLPQATARVCEFCKKQKCPLVTGVTGRNDAEQALVDELKNHVKVVESRNFSVGIAAMKKFCADLAQLGWECEIVETHRKGKKDSPSGTAKELATTVLKCGKQRAVQIHALRLGSNFGRHEVVFATEGESLTLIHQAENCEIFAKGAVDAAENLTKH